MLVLRMAIGFVTNGAPEHRWRRFVVPATTFIAIVLLLAGASVLAMEERQAERLDARRGLLAQQDAETDLFMLLRFERFRDEQIVVVYVEPAGDEAPVLPPGLAAIPAPGESVVSPAVDRLIRHYPELQQRYPEYTVLDNRGVYTGSEYLIYTQPAESRTIADDPRTQRIAGFGSPTATYGYGFTPVFGRLYLLEGMIACLALPAILTIVAGSLGTSSLRDHRFLILHVIGISSRSLVYLSTLETLLLALPGVLLGAIFWQMIAPGLVVVPLTDRRVVRGDLVVDVSDMLLVALATLLLVALVAGITSWTLVRRSLHGPRPVLARRTISWWRLAPLPAGFGVLAYAAFFAAPALVEVLVPIALVLVLLSIPIVFAGFVRAIGAAIADLRWLPASLAGRQMEWNPIGVSRPFGTFGALIMIVVIWLGLGVVLTRAEPPPGDSGALGAVVVDWVDPRDGDLERLQGAIDNALVVRMARNESMVLATSCAKLHTVIRSGTCNPDRPFSLPEAMSKDLGSALVSRGTVALVEGDDMAVTGSALVLSREPLRLLDEQVWTAAVRKLPAPSVTSWESFIQRKSKQNTWLIGGVKAALISGLIVTVLMAVDQLIAHRGTRDVLLRIGVARQQMQRVEGWLFLVPYLTVLGASLTAGIILCWAVVRFGDLPMPWTQIWLLTGVALLIGILGAIGAALLGVSSTRERIRGG